MDLDKSVGLYYQLTNYFQNFRRYIQSLNNAQLLGEAVPFDKLDSCSPLASVPNTTIAYYPCGIIANSFFNGFFFSFFFLPRFPFVFDKPSQSFLKLSDTFSNLRSLKDGKLYEFSAKGIAWPGELEKFGNTKYQPDGDGVYPQIAPPPNWAKYNG